MSDCTGAVGGGLRMGTALFRFSRKFTLFCGRNLWRREDSDPIRFGSFERVVTQTYFEIECQSEKPRGKPHRESFQHIF